MIPLSEKLLYTTTRLAGIKANNQSSIGTGFVFNHEKRFFLITNKHVVDGVIEGEFTLHKSTIVNGEKKPDLGKNINIKFNQSNFIGHPDPDVDVTVMNISKIYNNLVASGDEPYILTITEKNIPKVEDLEKFIKSLEEIVFVGYPNGIWDSINSIPLMRKGITATPYDINFLGKPIFLIDASVFPGSSGSPVFIYYSGSYSDKEGKLYAGDRIYFIGIVAKVYQRQEQGEIVLKDIPTSTLPVPITNQMIDLGIVFKASTIIESINNYVFVVNQQNQTAG